MIIYQSYLDKILFSPTLLGRFRFTLRDNINFNYYIIINIMYISGSPLLYIVNKKTCI